MIVVKADTCRRPYTFYEILEGKDKAGEKTRKRELWMGKKCDIVLYEEFRAQTLLHVLPV